MSNPVLENLLKHLQENGLGLPELSKLSTNELRMLKDQNNQPLNNFQICGILARIRIADEEESIKNLIKYYKQNGLNLAELSKLNESDLDALPNQRNESLTVVQRMGLKARIRKFQEEENKKTSKE